MEEKGEGWLIFAGIVLGVAGVMRIFDAIWAFRYHGVLPQNLEDALFGHSLKTYGWVYLVIGIILILCAFGVVARSQFSRWLGIVAGAVAAIERDLVDALLPGVVTRLHRDRRVRDLRARCLRRPGGLAEQLKTRRTAIVASPLGTIAQRSELRVAHRRAVEELTLAMQDTETVGTSAYRAVFEHASDGMLFAGADGQHHCRQPCRLRHAGHDARRALRA